jgi:hypothetical protein
MAVRILEELRRPLPLALAIAAAAGWVIALFLFWSNISLRGAERDFAAQFERQRQAFGTLAELQARAAEVQADLTRTVQEREQAQAQPSASRQNLKTARQNATSATRQAEKQAQRLSQLQQNATARSQELAEVGRRLEAARQQEAQAREVLAKLTEESAAKRNEVAKAEQQLQQSRKAEAAAQNQKTTLTDIPTPAGDLFRDDLNIEDLPRAASPAGRTVDDSAAGPTGSVIGAPSAEPR